MKYNSSRWKPYLPDTASTADIERVRTEGRHRIDAVLGGIEAIVEDLLGCDAADLLGSITSHNGLRSAFFTDRDGPGHLLGRMKQVWIYFIGAFPGRQKLLKKITRASTEKSYLAAVDRVMQS